MTTKPTTKTASRRAPVAEPVLQTSAKCARCLFARLVAVPNDDYGNASKMCECHVARPTSHGFPIVRRDDFCSCHVDAETHERTFANLAPNI